jgi:hypothetical protein
MPNIDIPLPVNLQKLFELPPCDQLRLPFPEPLKVKLPTGGSLQAFTDISKGIPTDCSMTFNLLLQLAPFLGATECLFKVLKLIKPLIDVVKGLGPPPDPIKLGKAIPEFLKATPPVLECALAITPANILPFIRDLLCLILKVLKCFLGQMKTLLAMMKGLSLQIATAQATGNTELQKALECAQENAEISSKHLTKSIEPIGVLLDLIGPLMGIAGIEPIQLPSLGGQSDLDALQKAIQAVQGLVGTIQIVVDALGGCPS